MAILYLGLPLGALCLGEKGHPIVGALVGHTDAPGMRRLRQRLGPRAVPILGRPDLGDPSIAHLIESLEPEVILSWFWPRLIPPEILQIPKRGAFGVHPSLLPRWRGRDPTFWAIRNGDRETGVTLHRLAPGYDKGAIIEQIRLPIDPNDTGWTLARRLDRPGLSLLTDCARRLRHGESLEGYAQNESLVTEAPQPSDDDLTIDWNGAADDIVRLVRAASPWPGARARLGETAVEVLAASEAGAPAALVAGEAVANAQGVVVRAKDSGVLVTCVRAEDGSLHRGRAIAELPVF